MRTPLFTGVCPALVTPFHKSGSIDFDAFAKLIDYQISAGVDAVCVCGTTGESAALSPAEHDKLIKFCVDHVNRRVKVIAGTGSNNTVVAVDRSRQAEDLGADGVLVVTPYYNKATQAGLLRHYEAIASAIDLPMILYNVPGRTGLSFTADTYRQLAQIPNINGVKEASGDLSLVTHTREYCPDDFFIWSGNDDQVVPMMALGARGVISVVSNIVPEIMVQMTGLCLGGDFPAAAKLQIEYASLIDALFAEVNPIPIKAAMELLGVCGGYLRLPLCSPSEDTQNLLRCELTRLELL